MATKINPDFYGAENTFVTVSGSNSVKRCSNTVGQLMANDIYTGGSFDTTATPWGIGESSVSSDFYFIASKGSEWTITDYNNPRKNTPIWFYFNSSNIEGGDDPSDLEGSSASSWFYSRAMYKNRLDPDATIYNTEIHSTMTIDENARIDLPNSVGQYPITYADYQTLRLVIDDVWVKQEGSNSITRTNMTAIQNGTVTVDKLIRFDFSVYDTNGVSTRLQLSIGGSELDIPETFKTCYYDDKDKWVRPWHRISSVGYWYSSPYDHSVGFSVFNTDTGVAYTSSWETLSADDNAIGRPNSNAWGHISSKLQVFDDVAYHWLWGISHYNSDQFVISQIRNGDTFTSETLRNFAYMEFDYAPDDKNTACFNAVLHEAAFLGFPIVISTSDVSETIGSDKVYLPVFDEHLITTGEFISGAESLTLPNALWNDIFGSEMPEYDPDYEPDEPVPPSGDFGDLNDRGIYTNRFPSKLNVWCFYNVAPHDDIESVITAINNLYITDPDGNEKWQLDFKGTNPSDYIVGLYVTPLIVPHSQNTDTFTLGPVDFDGNITTYRYDGDGYFTFGTIKLYGKTCPLFNNFRDYAPYTQLELYIPLCGTVTLDPAFFMGHSVTVDMYYDITTMSCTAAIYRDNVTLYKTVNGTLGAQIPITSLDMGAYQNTIKSLESAQKQNEMRLMTSVMTMGASAAAAIATGGVSLGVGAGALAGGAGLLQTVEQGKQIDYQLDHTAPNVSQTGTAEPQNGFCVGSMYPYLFVKRAEPLSGKNDTIYSKTVGNACCINDYIGSRTGLVVCSNINTNDIVNAYGESPTVDEINAIKQAFANGVYV